MASELRAERLCFQSSLEEDEAAWLTQMKEVRRAERGWDGQGHAIAAEEIKRSLERLAWRRK